MTQQQIGLIVYFENYAISSDERWKKEEETNGQSSGKIRTISADGSDDGAQPHTIRIENHLFVHIYDACVEKWAIRVLLLY